MTTPGIKRQAHGRIGIRCQEWKKIRLKSKRSNSLNKRTPEGVLAIVGLYAVDHMKSWYYKN